MWKFFFDVLEAPDHFGPWNFFSRGLWCAMVGLWIFIIRNRSFRRTVFPESGQIWPLKNFSRLALTRSPPPAIHRDLIFAKYAARATQLAHTQCNFFTRLCTVSYSIKQYRSVSLSIAQCHIIAHFSHVYAQYCTVSPSIAQYHILSLNIVHYRSVSRITAPYRSLSISITCYHSISFIMAQYRSLRLSIACYRSVWRFFRTVWRIRHAPMAISDSEHAECWGV